MHATFVIARPYNGFYLFLNNCAGWSENWRSAQVFPTEGQARERLEKVGPEFEEAGYIHRAEARKL